MAAPTKSTVLTNLELTKTVLARPDFGGRIRKKYVYGHTIPFTSSAIGDQHRMLRFNSGDIIYAIYIFTNGASTAHAANLGLYLANDGAVLDADMFASAYSLTTAVVPQTTAVVNSLYESAVVSPLDSAEGGTPLWSQLSRGVNGATVALGGSDPIEEYDMVFTATTACTVVDDIIGLEVTYSAGD